MKKSFEELVKVTKKLRGKDGCSWDKEQTFETIKEKLLEETNEAVEAIDKKDYENLKEELGDLMYNIILISEIAEEQSLFNMKDSLESIREKLIKRHPHVFGNKKLETREEVVKYWKQMKKQDKENKK